jgi:hypothetical protein
MEMTLSPAEVKVLEVACLEKDTPPAPRSLILKVGSCLVDESAQDWELDLDEEEFWFLREKVNLFATLEGRNIGLPLKRKIYQALLSYDTERIAGRLKAGPVDEDTYRKRSKKEL